MVSHQLALPLPPDYVSSVCHESYSFFNSAAPSQYGVLNDYLDDLCAFLRECRLIQWHPVNFFNLVRGEPWRRQGNYLEDKSVTAEEVEHTVQLCNTLGRVLDCADCMTQMRSLLREGPPPELLGDTMLQSFYANTKRLMLNRQRRPDNDVASLTLLQRMDADGSELHEGTYQRPAWREDVTTVTQGDSPATAQRRQRVLEMVLSHGMSPKKQHEVGIMTDTVADLVNCCRRSAHSERPNAAHETDGMALHTVINIGEGKGYVSRALALCNRLQVVGIDCNPMHKEKMPERAERLLEAGLSLRDGECGRDMLNLMYEPRGHIASVVCRLESAGVQWDQLLHGHVDTAHEREAYSTSPVHIEACGNKVQAHRVSRDASLSREVELTQVFSEGLHQTTCKISCKLCGKVMRLAGVSAILKHVDHHLKVGCEVLQSSLPAPLPARLSVGYRTVVSTAAGGEFPSKDTVDRWNVELPQTEFVARLTHAFFAPLVSGTRGASPSSYVRGSDPVAASPKVRCGDDVLGYAPSMSDDVFELLHLPRGMRAAVWVARRRVPDSTRQADGTPIPPGASEAVQWDYVDAMLTVIGYDDATGRHQVVLDDESRKESYALLRFRSHGSSLTPMEPAEANAEAGSATVSRCRIPSVPPHLWAMTKKALVYETVPMAPLLRYTLQVPSLRNAAIIGLHPCGDLGSNVCRIFAQSEARGLVLVSCCWHALTHGGFPLSEAMRRRGMSIENISLLLATQPFSMWATASPQGHHSSAKVLFFRTLLSTIWADWSLAWSTSVEGLRCNNTACVKGQATSNLSSPLASAAHSSPCSFAPLPHLEPAFLRHIARVKDTLSFAEFVDLVLQEYIYADTAKSTEYTWQTTVCAGCRQEQELFLRASKAAAVEKSQHFYQRHFGAFLGLTVLRMWMCHLPESLLLLDRALYLHETLAAGCGHPSPSCVSLVPLFDGAISPRMYAVLARRL